MFVAGIEVFMTSYFFFFKRKTAYEMRISDWSSDVCSSDLLLHAADRGGHLTGEDGEREIPRADAGNGTERAVRIVGKAAPALTGIVAEEIGRASCRARVCPYV